MKLLGVSDIARLYNIPRHSVWNLHRRVRSFPKPVQYISNGRSPLFDQEEIDLFMKNSGLSYVDLRVNSDEI